MKKILLFSAFATVLGLSSCNTGNGESTSTQTFNTYQLITNLDTRETIASTGTYTFSFNWTSNVCNVITDNLIINNQNWSMGTNQAPLYAAGGEIIIYPEGAVTGSSSLPLSNSEFIIAPIVPFGYAGVYYNETPVPGYNAPSANGYYMIGNYNMGNEYKVSTFIPDAFFYGTTISTYPDSEGTASNKSETISYRIVMNVKDKKADLIIYNAKFSGSEREPVKAAIIAKDLSLEFSNGGYTIKGENIIPSTLEGSQTTPNESFIFNSINISNTSSNLSEVKIDFVVAGIYTGSFTGSYYFVPKKP